MIHAMMFVIFAGMILYGMAGMAEDKKAKAAEEKHESDLAELRDTLIDGGVCLCDIEHREGARFCHECGGFALQEKN